MCVYIYKEREREREREDGNKFIILMWPNILFLNHIYLCVCVCVCVCDETSVS